MIPKKIVQILNTLEQNGFEAYIVGGFVRDTLFYKKTNDIDIATNALPRDLIQIFGPPKRKIEYGSYHMHIESDTIDITTYRSENAYEDGKPLDFSYSNNLLEDARRRDFTMNAMYMNKLGKIIDPYQGRIDIDHKILKMIGNPRVRIQEDPSRIIRAVRFASIYHLKLERSLIQAIQKEKKNLNKVPISLLRKELDKILLSNGFHLLKSLGLLNVLGIENHHLTYVEDISGLWAQIKTDRDYITEKYLQKNQKEIAEMVNCGTISMLDLYEYGIYECRVAASIMHFPMRKLSAMIQKLPMMSRKDMMISSEEIAKLSQKNGKELGILIHEIEKNIVLGNIKNTKESIIEYIKRRG